MRHAVARIDSEFKRFNPRIHEGCDQTSGEGSFFQRRFNPRIHEGCDDIIERTFQGYKVSIHASMKDATTGNFIPDGSGIVSIHASMKDATKWFARLLSQGPVSIHASMKDATRLVNNGKRQPNCFNPRIHEGCDGQMQHLRCCECVSIHASMKDATRAVPGRDQDKSVSIHASMKDATVHYRPHHCCQPVSIHASMKDATFWSWADGCVRKFQSTHP